MRIMRLCGHITSGLHARFKLAALILAALSGLASASPVWAQDIEWTRQFGTTSSSQFDGVWSGETSQLMEFSFTVVDNAIPRLTWEMHFPRCSSSVKVTIRAPVTPFPIDDANSFSLDSTSQNGSFKIAGTFASDTSASGSLEARQKFRNRCTGVNTATWEATKTVP